MDAAREKRFTIGSSYEKNKWVEMGKGEGFND